MPAVGIGLSPHGGRGDGDYAEKGEYDRAVGGFATAVKVDSKNPEYCFLRSLAYEAGGRTQHDDADLHRARELGLQE